jgi:hypothetical protein
MKTRPIITQSAWPQVVFIFVTIIGAASTGVGGAPDCNGEPFQLNSALPIIDLLQSLGKCPSTVVNLLGRSIPQQVRSRMICLLCLL